MAHQDAAVGIRGPVETIEDRPVLEEMTHKVYLRDGPNFQEPN